MTIVLDVPENIKEIVKKRSEIDYIDEETVAKQLLLHGVELLLVEQYSKGEISLEKACELLGVDIYRMQEILRKYGFKANISYEKFVRGVERAKQL